MKKKCIISSIIILSFFIFNIKLVYSQVESPEDLFLKVRSNYINQLPTDFTAEVSSWNLERELQNVPDYEKIDPSKPFKIKFLFIKEYGERLIVDNACMLTRNRFHNYLEVYQSFRSFLEPSINAESFFRRYNWEIISNNRAYYVIKMSTRGITNEYYQIYINKSDMLLARTFYFKDNNQVGRIDITYNTVRGYKVPNIINGYSFITNEKNETERKEFELQLKNFKINIDLTIDDILGDDGVDC